MQSLMNVARYYREKCSVDSFCLTEIKLIPESSLPRWFTHKKVNKSNFRI
ncbi:hypothetical protein [Moorena producens]|nr:hypothetical protein [Moorena producens]